MTTPAVTEAILHTIRQAGYSMGEVRIGGFDGQVCDVVDAVDARTGDSFTVLAPTEYEAVVELARQVGIELEDG